MPDVATATTAAPTRPLPRVAFVGVTGAQHPVQSACVAPGAYAVAVDTTAITRAGAIAVMEALIGPFEDVTLPGAMPKLADPDDQAIAKAIRPLIAFSANPQATARRLIVEAVDAIGDLAPQTGREDWSAADANSDPMYIFASFLIGETVKRHVIGARYDGRRPAAAARSILPSLIAACQITVAEYTGGQL